jgi:DNA-binding NarL/FixJ family response regulator
MRARIAVWDPLPVYRRGIIATLSDVGFSVEGPEEPDDLLAWSAEKERRVALVTLDCPEPGQGWSTLSQLKHLESGAIVVALLTDVVLESYIRAISLGATSAVARNAAPETIRQVVVEATYGRTLLPTRVVSFMATQLQPAPPHDRPSEEHLEWLRALSRGTRIAQIADLAGYSERAMYRRLKDMYREIGARNRTEAIMKASQSGWL